MFYCKDPSALIKRNGKLTGTEEPTLKLKRFKEIKKAAVLCTGQAALAAGLSISLKVCNLPSTD